MTAFFSSGFTMPWRRFVLSALLLPLVLLVAMPTRADGFADVGGDDDWQYRVQVDDTIWDICKSYVAIAQCWKKLVAYNEIKTPKYLPPNSIVRIPRVWLKKFEANALVIAVQGEVTVIDADKQRTDLKVGDRLAQQDTVIAENGSAMIEFADSSRLLLKPNSAVRMQGLRYYQRDEIANTQIELLKGRVKASVEKLKGMEGRFQISTPAAVAAVRGTEFRVALPPVAEGEKAVMLTELLTGKLLMNSEQNTRPLEAGQAVKAVEGEGVSEPVTLLPRPQLLLDQAEQITLPYELHWQPVAGAAFYRITLMQGERLLWERDRQTAWIDFDVSEDADYRLMIRAVDQQGFEGFPRRLRLKLD